jgi:hypothetical protein
VTIASGQQEAEQQCGIINGTNDNVKSTGNGIFCQNDVLHIESNFDEKETLEQRNGSPAENVTRIAQLSRETDHIKQNETIEKHPNGDY